MKTKRKIKAITTSAVIASLYVVLTYITCLFGLANGAVQCRLSESLLILPMFTPSAMSGLFIGCIISNILTGGIITDVIFGSLATLAGVVGVYLLRKRHPATATLANVVSNMIVVPFVLKYAYGLDGGLLYFVLTVGVGEIISCTVLGTVLYGFVKKYEKILF